MGQMRRFHIKVDTDIINNNYQFVIEDRFRYRSDKDRSFLIKSLDNIAHNFKLINGVSFTRVPELESQLNSVLNDALKHGAIIFDKPEVDKESLYKEEPIEARYGIAFASSPYTGSELRWYTTEERRDEVYARLEETGEIDTSTNANPLGRVIKVYSYTKILVDLTIKRRITNE
jgi:hypothetical protein